MSHRCRPCEKYENKQTSLHERRVLLWRRGQLTDKLAEELDSEKHQLTEELEKHQAAYHQESPHS